MTSVFGARPSGYKWGFALLLLSVMCYVIGFSSPYWSKVNLSKFYMNSHVQGWVRMGEHAGLWEVCYYIEGTLAKECLSTGEILSPGWFSSVKGLECVGLVCLLAACGYAIAINWIQSRPRFSRLLEITSALGGLSGCIGIIIYINNATDDAMESMLLDFFVSSNNSQIDSNHVAWAFWMAAAGSGFSMLSSILIAIFNRYPLNIPDPDSNGLIYDPETGLPIDPSALTDLDLINAGTDGDVYCIANQAMAAGFSPPSYDSLSLGKDGFLKPPPYEALQGPGEGQGSRSAQSEGQGQGSSSGVTSTDAAESARVAESVALAPDMMTQTAVDGHASEHASDEQTGHESQQGAQDNPPEDLQSNSQGVSPAESQNSARGDLGFSTEEPQGETPDSLEAGGDKEQGTPAGETNTGETPGTPEVSDTCVAEQENAGEAK